MNTTEPSFPGHKLVTWDKIEVFRGVLAVVILLGPPIYLALRPQDYTPLLQVLISIFLFLLAYWVGFTKEADAAARRANDRWLPQAHRVICPNSKRKN